MAIGKATCPSCGSLFQVDTSMVGKSVLCPWCGEEIFMEGVDVPDVADGIPGEVAPVPEASPEELPATPPPPSPEPAEREVVEGGGASVPRGSRPARTTPPFAYAVFAAVMLLCVCLGYLMAMKRQRPKPVEPQAEAEQTAVSLFPPVVEPAADAAADDEIADAAERDGEGAGLPATASADAVEDEDPFADVADFAQGAVEEAEPAAQTEPEAAEVAGAEGKGRDAGGEDVADVDGDAAATGPFVLDAAALADAYRDSGIANFKCRTALGDFEKAVAAANAMAETNRASMAQVVAKYLRNGMLKAQSTGDLERVVAFKKALDTADAGIDGELPEIVKLRDARDAKKAKIDNVLLAAGATAAKGLHGALEWQKKETTRKNEIAEAQKIAAYQKKVEEWMTKTKESASGSSVATVRRPAAPVSQPVRHAMPKAPEAKVYTVDSCNGQGTSIGFVRAGDTLEFQYVGGKWACWSHPVVSPDDKSLRNNDERVRVCKKEDINYILALIPSGTAESPFQYVVDEDDAGEIVLRMHDKDYSSNTGAVRYSVKIIPGEASRAAGGATSSLPATGDTWAPPAVRPSPYQPSRQASTSTGGQSWRRIQVDARAFKGMPFSVRAGDVISIQYVDGTWTYSNDVQKQNPDADRDVEDGNRCALADSLHPGETLAVLPSNTKGEPFEYTVEKDGAFCLRINDGGHESPYRDNRGFVTYMVKVVSASGGRTSPRTIAGDGIPSASSGFSNHVLTGTQTDVSVTLSRSPTPHVVKEQYLVPQGKELIIEAGATLVFDEGASLYCEGTLKMNGTEQAPIICKGRMSRAEYWNGITVKTTGSEINWLTIRDAKNALTCKNGSPIFKNCIFAKNGRGIVFGNSSAKFENCLICENASTGIHCEYDGRVRPVFIRCTFTQNGSVGVACGYYGSPQLEFCQITKNGKGGVHTYLYGCEVRANNCIIMDNKGYDVEHNASPLLNFRQNYWGPSVTRLLQQRGDGYNLPNIKDGRDSGGGNIVDIAEFQTEPPKDCGATVRW